MGIDIYMEWDNMTKADSEKQITGFDTTAGNVGYLREAYHGEPYATHFFVKEAFSSSSNVARIKADKLISRLPKTLKLAKERMEKVYNCYDQNEIKAVQKSYADFAELAKIKEHETGKPVKIIASY